MNDEYVLAGVAISITGAPSFMRISRAQIAKRSVDIAVEHPKRWNTAYSGVVSSRVEETSRDNGDMTFLHNGGTHTPVVELPNLGYPLCLDRAEWEAYKRAVDKAFTVYGDTFGPEDDLVKKKELVK